MSLRAKFLYAAAKVYWRITRPVTLGVRLLMIKDGRVVLVKHTYQPEWFLPGGGVKRGEDLEAAVRREAREEVGARLGSLRLFGVYSNLSKLKSDHIVTFVCETFDLEASRDFEIERFDFFDLDGLPDSTSIGSRRRVQEYIAGHRQPQMKAW